MTEASTGWTEPAFLADAHAWIRAQLPGLGAHLTGSIEQIHDRPWSTILRAPTDRGRLFFKAAAAACRHEVGLVVFLAGRRPDVVLAPLAVDLERGWMLMADAGDRLREVVERERDLTPWLDILPLYAGLQVDASGDVAELLALGVPDLRLTVLPARYEALVDALDALEDAPRDLMQRLRDAVQRVSTMCAQLAAYGIPETIEHDDLHDAAIYLDDGRYRILDWGDACVSHPFFSMSVALEGVIAWGVVDVEGSVDLAPFRDAYLAPFAIARAGENPRGYDDLRAALTLALRLGWVCRAVNDVPVTGAASTWTRLRMFLDGRP